MVKYPYNPISVTLMELRSLEREILTPSRFQSKRDSPRNLVDPQPALYDAAKTR